MIVWIIFMSLMFAANMYYVVQQINGWQFNAIVSLLLLGCIVHGLVLMGSN